MQDLFDLEFENLITESDIEKMEKVQSNLGPNELSPEDRADAIHLLESEYIAKYPIEYFKTNEDKKHDRTIAQITVSKEKENEATAYMAALIKTLNGKPHRFTFIYVAKDHIVIANRDKKEKPKEKKDSSNKKPTKEDTGLEYLETMDPTGAYCVEDFRYLPLVQNYMSQGLSLPKAVQLIEAQVMLHPILLLDLVPESYFKNDSDYDDYLVECFLNAINLAGGDEALAQKSVFTAESVNDASIKNIRHVEFALESPVDTIAKTGRKVVNTVSDAKDSAKEGIRNTKTAAVNALKPVVMKMKDAVDSLIGDKATKKEVVTGSTLLRLRRIFIKLIMVWKSNALTNAFIALLPGGFVMHSLLRIPLFLSRLCFYFKSAKAVAFNSGVDDQNRAMQKRCEQELELELKICREKIDDAKSAGNNKAKYDLMRVENTIEREIRRVKYSETPDDYTQGSGHGVFTQGHGNMNLGIIKTGTNSHN